MLRPKWEVTDPIEEAAQARSPDSQPSVSHVTFNLPAVDSDASHSLPPGNLESEPKEISLGPTSRH